MDLLAINADLDDMYLSDSTTSSESSEPSDNVIFSNNEHLVLELHELKRDTPNPAKPVPKTRKTRRKRKVKESSKPKHTSSSSPSETSVKPKTQEPVQEEFFDAHESFHGLTQDQVAAPTTTAAKPIASATLMEAHSEHGPDMKIVTPGLPTPTQESPPTAIKKPVAPPD